MDIDGDGYPDLISGSWPGEIFLFRGTADHSFAAPEMLKDKSGEIINIGGGVGDWDNPGGNKGILIRGMAQWETVDGKRFVTYHGQRFESTPEKPVATTGTASVVSVTDWDGNGTLDLIVGTVDGDVYFIPNEGTPKSYAFGKPQRLTADGKPVHVESRAGPCVADWDGDGKLDLLVGSEDGSVSLYRNVGTRTAPKLAAPVQLVAPGQSGYGADAPREVHRGTRSKLCVVDWNGDGKPDLLLGDFGHQRPNLPEPTPEELTKYDRIRKELEPLQKRRGELAQKLFGSFQVRTKEERDKAEQEMNQLREQMQPLESQLPRESESHGWVWLFLRK
jgi:hypothetical protein